MSRYDNENMVYSVVELFCQLLNANRKYIRLKRSSTYPLSAAYCTSLLKHESERKTSNQKRKHFRVMFSILTLHCNHNEHM